MTPSRSTFARPRTSRIVSSACSQVTFLSEMDTRPLTSSPDTMFRPLSAARIRSRLTTSASLKSSEISFSPDAGVEARGGGGGAGVRRLGDHLAGRGGRRGDRGRLREHLATGVGAPSPPPERAAVWPPRGRDTNRRRRLLARGGRGLVRGLRLGNHDAAWERPWAPRRRQPRRLGSGLAASRRRQPRPAWERPWPRPWRSR